MCETCIKILNGDKIIIPVRSHMADENICEYINGLDCSCCKECFNEFYMSIYEIDGSYYFQLGYNQKIYDSDKKVIKIEPFSELSRINYCPNCGRSLEKL